ncbi:MAG: thiamine pyrophosphate-dependent enzyme, partial [Pseudomonadota bacterium]
MSLLKRHLLSGNQAVALAAKHAHVALGTGYPGTPSTEILEEFNLLGGKAQWAPNEKVALEVGIGAAFGSVRAIVTMKHVGLNVAADPLFTSAYTGVSGSLVVVSADDPGMASSQNEQDNRHYARAAGLPMFEPADSQEAYDFTIAAFELSQRWNIPVILRMTTRVCHSKSVVTPCECNLDAPKPDFKRDRKGLVMIPSFAKVSHRKLRDKLKLIAAWNETCGLNKRDNRSQTLGIISSGISAMYAREAAPQASHLRIAVTYPLPIELIRDFAKNVEKCVVVEEGDNYLLDSIRAEGIVAQGKNEIYLFDELNVERTAQIIQGNVSPEPKPALETPPKLCQGCPYRPVFETLAKLDCIVTGDIGCYTLAVQPPFNALDSCVCMGASIGVGLGLRHVLPEQQAKRVVSVIGDSTFVHSGITGLVEMMYNPPATGHVLIILDNGTIAMTGLQDHPGTGRTLDRTDTCKVVYEDLAKTLGVKNVYVLDPTLDRQNFEDILKKSLSGTTPTVIIARHACLLETPRRGDSSRDISVAAPADGLQHLSDSVVNVAFAGLGGQGVIMASDILAEVMFAAG